MFKCPNFSVCKKVFPNVKSKCNHSKNCGIVRVCGVCQKKFMSDSGFRKHTKHHNHFPYIAGHAQVKDPVVEENASISPHTSMEDGRRVPRLDEETFATITNSPVNAPALETGSNYLNSAETGVNPRPSTSTKTTSTTFGDPGKDLVYEKWFEQAETAGMNLRKTIVMYEKKLDWYAAKAEEEHWEVAKILGEEIVNGQTLLKIKWKPSYITLDEARKFSPKALEKFMAKNRK